MVYQRPAFFRFAFSSPHPYPPLSHLITEHVAGFDGTDGYFQTKSPKDVAPSRDLMSVRLAMAGATGVSSGSAHTIGRLLLPEVHGTSMLDLLDPRFNADAEIDGKVCYSISAQHPKSNEREVWVEKESLLLRKLIWIRETARSEEVREDISVNEPIEPQLFAAP
jgi:hypothetical protein